MLLIGELLFVGLLVFSFVILYKNERITLRKRLSRAVVEECWDGKERRKCARFSKTLNATYVLKKKPHLKASTKTVDISEGGVKLVLDKKLAKDTILGLKLELPDARNEVEIEGKVAWSEETSAKDEFGKRFFYAGIMFLEARDPSGKSLIKYIQSISNDPRA